MAERRIGWVDASAGASGDMLLGALLGAGVPLEVLQSAIAVVGVEPIAVRHEPVSRAGLSATRCLVGVAADAEHRTLSDITSLLQAADLASPVRDRSLATFATLARAEGAVHGVEPDDVRFHEVGALDAIADIVGVCAGFAHLGLEEIVVSTIGVGSGRVTGAHGVLPVPPPAVTELLRGVPTTAGPATSESCTPTGAALLVQWATSYGPQPTMSVVEVGVGAGGRDPETHANVTRLLIGDPFAAQTDQILFETNVDDLDPRVWPQALAALFAAGAVDAWLTPILMKKGRPAHTLSALVPLVDTEAVRAAIFRHTTAIGLREVVVVKTACERRFETVSVQGHGISVKVATWQGQEVNAQPEYDDAAAAAHELGRPVGEVLAQARAAYERGKSR